MSQLLQYVGSCLGKYHLYTLYCVHLWMFWKNSKHFLDFKWGALFNLIDLNSTEFPCFEKVHPSPISLIFPSRSSFIKQQIVQMRMIHILHRIFQFRCQRDQPRKPNFCVGATSKKRQSGKSLPAMFWSKKDEHLERTSFLWVTRPFQMCSHSPG